MTLVLCAAGVASGCATTGTGTIDDPTSHDQIDPFEDFNRKIYAFNEGLDQHLIKPIAIRYVDITSEPVRVGVGNFFNNINYINVIVNSSLQGKLDQSLSDLFRFLFNSTLGVAGIFDVASDMGLKEHREDLGQTFAVWGIAQGPYLTLPLFGSSTGRDAPDIMTSAYFNPLYYLGMAIYLPTKSFDIINQRARLLKASSIRDVAALDGYSFNREAYLQQRRNLIYDGYPPPENYDDFFNDDFFEMDPEGEF
ncbi:MAG: VacJ family lipoprotein [Gammaproteobacteria bacterium]